MQFLYNSYFFFTYSYITPTYDLLLILMQYAGFMKYLVQDKDRNTTILKNCTNKYGRVYIISEKNSVVFKVHKLRIRLVTIFENYILF